MKRASSDSFKLKLVALLVAGLFASPESGAALVVPGSPAILQVKTVVNPNNGHTYHLISGEATLDNPLGGLSWSVADAYAKSLSTDTSLAGLVSIGSAAEQDWIANQFPAVLSDQGDAHQVIWIGLNDRQNEGVYRWENGDDVDYSNWAANLPNDPNGSEDYVYLTNTSMFDPFIPLGSWNDYVDEPTFFGALPFSAIVEVQSVVGPIPEPSSALLVLLSAGACLRRRR